MYQGRVDCGCRGISLDYKSNRFIALLFSAIFILRSGDIQTNPGPLSNSEPSETSSISSYSNLLNKGLSVMHLNIQSLKPKIDILSVEAQPYDILVFTETWLSHNTTNDELSIPNFCSPFRKDRSNGQGGGVAIYVKKGFYAVERPDLNIHGLEALWIELTVNHRKLLIGGIYRPPNSNNTHWHLLEQSFDQAFNLSFDNILITGDFNINLLTHNADKMNHLITSYQAEQLITAPTHFTEHSQSLIDLMIVKDKEHIISSFVSDPFVPDLIRYHCPIVTILKFSKHIQHTFKRRIWLYDKGDYTSYKDKLRAVDWNNILSDQNLEQTAINITNSIILAASETIPNKLVTIRPNDIPWMHRDIRKLINTRRKLHKQAKHTNTESDWDKFRQARNQVTKEIRIAKHNHHNKLIEQINASNTTAKQWFKLAKRLTNKNNETHLPTLIDNGIEATTNTDKAELLNAYFSKQSTLDDNNHPLPPNIEPSDSSLSSISISVDDVRDAISCINPSKASGPDLISPRLIREGSDELCKPLSTFFTNLLDHSLFPSSYKLANVTPIFKKGDPSKPSNYRPVSLLSCMGKLMERCVHKYLYNYITSNKLLTSFQSGFIKGDSTVNQLVYVYNDICHALDEGKEVRAVFCDISKAFDRVWHRGLLFKLSKLGIKDSLLNWFSSYLSSRKQRVVYANSTSNWSTINAGVPQGSILGPLLFLIYINDIINNINANVRLFADDTSLYIVVDTPDNAAATLNKDLDTIFNWSKTWLVSFNPTKTESMIFSKKRKQPPHPTLFMNHIAIDQFDSHKHLGVTLSSDAKWNTHISITLKKAWQRIGILRSLKFILTRSGLERMYNSFIRPILEYGDVLWDNCTISLQNDIEAVHNEAARIVAGATKYCNIKNLLSDLKWQTLADRRKNHKLILFYKMHNNLTPDYLSQMIPASTQNSYSLRNSDNTPTIQCRTQTYQSSFLPSTIIAWNALPSTTKNKPTLQSFKSALNRNTSKASPLFNIGSRSGQILHARLRLGCSALNYDLSRRSLVDSPLCTCGNVETVKHFLLHCPKYNRLRNDLISNLPCPPLLNNLLYGDDKLSPTQNISIITNVQRYILASKRFNSS